MSSAAGSSISILSLNGRSQLSPLNRRRFQYSATRFPVRNLVPVGRGAAGVAIVEIEGDLAQPHPATTRAGIFRRTDPMVGLGDAPGFFEAIGFLKNRCR
jgi:hypothetical protein